MARFTLVWFFLFFFLARPLGAAPCWGGILASNLPPSKKEVSLLILPFENFKGSVTDKWFAMGIPLLMGDTLSSNGKIHSLPPDPEWWEATFSSERGLKIARSVGANYLLIGRLFRKEENLQVETILLSAGGGQELVRVNGTLEFPGTARFNDLLVALLQEYGKADKNFQINPKKIFPLLNRPASPDALRFFVAASLLMMEGGEKSAAAATTKFEEAIKQDYNYVPGYVGLAQSLVTEGLLQRMKGNNVPLLWQRARVELEKARLLNPTYVKVKGEAVEKYLEAYVKLETATRAEEREKVLNELNSCGG